MPQSITCPYCNIVQFSTTTGRCQRCRQQFGAASIEIPLPGSEALFGPAGEQYAREFMGKLFRRLRRRAGYTQVRFASVLGAAGYRSHISRIENAHIAPSVSLLLRAAARSGADSIILHIRKPEI